MKLLEIYIRGFGKFKDKKLLFDPGMNVLYGKNEAGKSTIHNFIKAMFYGLERGRGRASKNDAWTRNEPWDKHAYGGYIRLSKNNEIYRIERDFSKNAAKPLCIINESSGLEAEDPAASLAYLLNGLSLTAYNNTVSIGQLRSTTDAGMTNELRNYIANMNNTGSEALNITRASAYLRAQKRAVLSGYTEEASKAYAANLAKIQSIEAIINGKAGAEVLAAKQASREQLMKEIARQQVEIEQLEQYITETEQKLGQSYFHNVADIDATQRELEEKSAAYLAAKKENIPNKARIGSILLGCFAAFCALIAAYMFFAGQGNVITATLKWNYDISITLLVLLATVCAIIAGILAKMVSSKLSQRNYAVNSFAFLLESITGMKGVSEENIESARFRLEEYRQGLRNIELAGQKKTELASALSRLQENEEKESSELENKQRNRWEAEKAIEQISNLQDENNALKRAIEENNRILEEVSAIELALETMTRLSTSIKDSFGFYLNKEASLLISGITGGIYDSLSIDRDMSVFLNTSSRLVPIDQVSSGTMDQVYLALRLATAKLMQEDKEKLPLILDDSFVNYDDIRLNAALNFLYSSYDAQILLFSCHPREAQILASFMKPYHLLEI